MNYLKYSIGAVIVLAIVGAYFYPQFQSVTTLGASNTAGTNYNSSKVAEQNLVVATDTVFSQLNTDGTDRFITSFEFFATGGTATTSYYTINCATSTTAGGNGPLTSAIVSSAISSANANATQSFGTTTGAGFAYAATSSPGLTGTTSAAINNGANPFVRIWPTGTYLTCKTANTTSGSNALNTLDANTVGFTAFGYRAQ